MDNGSLRNEILCSSFMLHGLAEFHFSASSVGLLLILAKRLLQ